MISGPVLSSPSPYASRFDLLLNFPTRPRPASRLATCPPRQRGRRSLCRRCSQRTNWFIVIYPSRSIEQTDLAPYQILFDSHHVHRIYLDELGPPKDLPLGLALMVLTPVKEAQAPAAARSRSVSTGESLMARVETAGPAQSPNFAPCPATHLPS